MATKLHELIQRHLVMTVPEELDACQECAQATCDGMRFDGCAYRLERLTELRRARAAGDPCDAAVPPEPDAAAGH